MNLMEIEAETIENVALFAGGLFTLPGIIFMLTCKTLWVPIASQPAFRKVVKGTDNSFKWWAGLCTHCCFILGMLAFVCGTTNLGIALKLPPALAMLCGMNGGITQLLYMVLYNQSPTGLPGVSGPPLPARILLCIIEVALLANAFYGTRTEYYSCCTFSKFQYLFAYGTLVPAMIAKHLRTQGWENHPSQEVFEKSN